MQRWIALTLTVKVTYGSIKRFAQTHLPKLALTHSNVELHSMHLQGFHLLEKLITTTQFQQPQQVEKGRGKVTMEPDIHSSEEEKHARKHQLI